MAGFWKQHEVTDGTYNYIDWLYIMESMQVQNENQWRDYEAGRDKN
jgi:hypothetical protein